MPDIVNPNLNHALQVIKVLAETKIPDDCVFDAEPEDCRKQVMDIYKSRFVRRQTPLRSSLRGTV